MKHTLLILMIVVSGSSKLFAQKRSIPYIDKDGFETVLTYNAKTGTSKLYYHKVGDKTFTEADYQLPPKPTGDDGPYEFVPYIDKDGFETVLTYNPVTGASKLYYHKVDEKNFTVADYQLPPKPTEDDGPYEFVPYLDKDGFETILTYNPVTGASKLYYHNVGEKNFILADYQLPKIE